MMMMQLRAIYESQHNNFKQHFFVLKNSYQSTPNLSYEDVLGMLDRVHETVRRNAFDFEWKIISRPRVGDAYVIYQPRVPNEVLKLPPDGYNWPTSILQQRVREKSTNKELEISTCMNGTGGPVPVTKRLYNLSGSSGDPGLIIIHYMNADAVPAPSPQPVKPPTQAPTITPQAQSIPTQPQIGSNNNQQVKSEDNTKDFLSEKNSSVARFSQFHEYIEEIFSPLTTKELIETLAIESKVENFDLLFEGISKKKKLIEDEVQNMNKKHKQLVDDIKSRDEKWMDYMKKIDDCKDIQEIEELTKIFEKEYNVKFVPLNAAVQVDPSHIQNTITQENEKMRESMEIDMIYRDMMGGASQ